MNLIPFDRCMIPGFLQMAREEGWIVARWEFEFLLSVFARGCFCAVPRGGMGVGFVTSLRHERSGWIGNLIVAAGYRGKGVGRMLFNEALESLRSQGAETVWLTASTMGKRLYERHGFRTIDTVNRWKMISTGRRAVVRAVTSPLQALALCLHLDTLAWGDRREGLLQAIMARGEALAANRGHLVMQYGEGVVQLGPFAAMDEHKAAELLEHAVSLVPEGVEICLDAPASNSVAERLFTRLGFISSGSTELMYAGRKPDYRPELLFGLATMGSCG